MTNPELEAKAIRDALEHPEKYCPICHKKIGVCKHTKSKCENCSEWKPDVKYTRQYGDGEFLCRTCRGE